jgi:hypothetical protein
MSISVYYSLVTPDVNGKYISYKETASTKVILPVMSDIADFRLQVWKANILKLNWLAENDLSVCRLIGNAIGQTFSAADDIPQDSRRSHLLVIVPKQKELCSVNTYSSKHCC